MIGILSQFRLFMEKKMSNPSAVLISDIHFTPNTIDLASAALLQAQFKAKMLNVPLIIAGDTMDTKDILRASCVNKLMRMLAVRDAPRTYLMVGNHDLCNEKGDDHALNFAFGLCEIVDKPHTVNLPGLQVMLIPYYSDSAKLAELLKDEEIPRTLIMHQGVQTAYMGHYVQDKTSLPKEAFADFRVISGHYHCRQDIKCGRPRKGGIGLFSYIGNPYTQNFAEAKDGPKGFQILKDDGLLEFVGLGLRKHQVLESHTNMVRTWAPLPVGKDDLLWLKLYGPKSELDAVNKQELGNLLFGHDNYRLELIPEQDRTENATKSQNLSDYEVMDSIIDSLSDSDEHKVYLKTLWKDLLDENS